MLSLSPRSGERVPEGRVRGNAAPTWLATLPAHREVRARFGRIGISEAEERRCLEALLAGGQIARADGPYVLTDVQVVDTRRDPAAGRALKEWWAGVGLERLRAGSDGLFSYNVFTVAEADLARLRELHLAYFREMRAIIAASQPGERVVVANLQLFALDARPEGVAVAPRTG